ncbi:MAG TPA: hypothetical protein VF824_16715 [Thermoanaerobaculia bacterium]|jgi:hypothetical protein
MKRTLIFTALFFAAAAAHAADSVTFGSTSAAAGMTWSESSTFTNDVTIGGVGGGAPLQVAQTSARSKQLTVREVGADGRIRSADVTYTAATDNDAVTGKTYRVTRSGNTAEVTYANGGTPPAPELAFVAADNPHFAQFRAYERIFGGKTFTIGSSTEPNRNDAQDLVNASGEVTVTAISLTLRSVTSGVATFDISMTLRSDVKKGRGHNAQEPASGAMTLTLDGTMTVAVATARVTSLDVTGPMHVTRTKPTGAVASDGSGNVSLHVEYGM